MTQDELFELLDMEQPEDFSFFEQFADLVECEEDIPEELILEAVRGLDGETAAELIDNYFEDTENAAPDNADELISLLETIKQNLILCTNSLEDVNVKAEFANQLYEFRRWLHEDRKAKIGELPCSVFYALTEYRGEKLGGGNISCDFSGAVDYEPENISLSLGAYSKVDIIGDDDEGKQQDN